MQSSISEGFPDLSMYDGNLRVADVVSDSPVSKLQLVEAREQKLVLKRYPLWFDEQDVLFVHEFNQFLFEGGLNTPRLIPTLQGDTFIKEGNEMFGVYEYVEAKRTEECEAKLEELGSTLGLIHKLSSLYSPRMLRRWWTVDTYKAEQYFGEASCLMEEEGGNRLISELELLKAGYSQVKGLLLDNGKYSQLGRLVIHGDFDTKNTLVQEGEVCVVDFDNAREEIREMDFVDPLRFFCKVPRDGWNDMADEFIGGYVRGSGSSDLDAEAMMACSLVSSVQEGCWQFRELLKTGDVEEHGKRMTLELDYIDNLMSSQEVILRGLDGLVEADK